jgi:hypothetical protein
MTAPATDLRQGGSGTVAPPGPTLLGLLSLLQPQYRWTRKNFFGYVTEFLPLTASLAITNTIAIAGDSDFLITFATCVLTDTTNLVQQPFIPQLVQLTDSAAGMAFFLLPEHANNVYGDAQNPGIFAAPYVMRQATSLAVQHTNLEATNRNVRVAFNGFKSYPGTDTRYKKWQG